ncbi:MAG TPA: hypothetical protein DD490_20300 [Acidobacteria bacterium]|nr:hypothetical protein [Acidobacteriota bacterium]
MNHPKPSVLRHFLHSLAVSDAGLVLHMMECPRCARQGWDLLTPRSNRRRPDDPGFPAGRADDAERAFARMGERVGRAALRLEEARRQAGPLVQELILLSRDLRQARLAADARFRTFFVAWGLLERSEMEGDAEEAEALGSLAAGIAEGLAGRGPGPGFAEGLAAAAWCAVGTARRRQGRLEEAEAALVRAVPHLDRSADAGDNAEYCRRLAGLRRVQRRLDEALALLERAIALFGGVGQARDQAMALADLAAVSLDQEDIDGAVLALDRILALGPAAVDPGLSAGAAWGIAGCLSTLQDPLLGRRLLALLAERPARRRTAVDRAILVRTEGLVAAFGRQEHLAETLLREAWSAFHRIGAAGYALLVGLDLAALFLRLGKAGHLRGLGGEIRLAFQRRDLPEGIQRALDDLLRTLEAGSIEPAVLAGIARYVARAMAQPELSYPLAS